MKLPLRYHNPAGTSWPKPPEVLAAAEQATRAPPDAWPVLFAEAHRAVAEAFGVAPDDLLITPSCTQALAVAVADVPWRPGDRALSSHLEHHALAGPLARLRGVEVTHIGRAADGPLDLDAVAQALARGGVKLVAASMASNVTGELLPWRELVDLAHRHGALCLLDGAQVAGWMDLDLAALEVDLFAFAGHKGPQAPSGVGGLYVRPGVFLETPAASCTPEACRPGPDYCDTGSVNLPALRGLAEGLAWMRRHAPLADALDAALSLRALLAEHPAVRLLGGTPGVPTCSFVVTGRSVQAVVDGLRARGVVAAAGLQCAPLAHEALGTAPEGAVRVSFGPGQGRADAEAVAAALLAVVG